MQQQAAGVVDFMRMTCGLKTQDTEKEIICKKFFGQGVQKFKKDNKVDYAVNDDTLRDYAIEIVFHAIEAFKSENIKTEVGHVWRPYVIKASSTTTTSSKAPGTPSVKSRPTVSKKSVTTSGASSEKKVKKQSMSAQSAVTSTDKKSESLEEVFNTLDITAKPTKAGMTGLKVEDLNRVCEALGGANFLEKIEVVHGKRDKPVKADLVDGIIKFLD